MADISHMVSRYSYWCVAIAVYSSLATGCAGGKATQETQGSGVPARAADADNDARARHFMELLVAHKFSQALSQTDDAMKAALPGDKLGELWASWEQKFGAFQAIAATRSELSGDYESIYVTVKFSRETMDIKVVIDKAHRVAGLFSKAVAAAVAPWTPPSYVDQAAFEERDVKIGRGEWELPGTLSMPKGAGPFPAVVLVHGSGPGDRDETLGPNKPLRDVAWGLASRGIAVIRYDKRTLVHRGKIASLAGVTVNEEAIDDALAAVALARDTKLIAPGRIFLLGHSLGGYLAPRILAADEAISGGVIFAGSVRPMPVLMREQVDHIAQIDGEVTDAERAGISQLSAELAKLDAKDFAATSAPVLGVPASYWIDLKSYDPIAVAKKISRPMLVLQGERDYQVTMKEFGLWKQGLGHKPTVAFASYPALNHLFIAGSGASTPDEYRQPGHVAEAVIAEIAEWIKSPGAAK